MFLAQLGQMSPHVAVAVAVSCLVGFLMIQAGLGKSALEKRNREKRCPSCGRLRRSCRCQDS